MHGCHRNLSGNDRAVAEAAVLIQQGGYRVHGTGANTGPVTGTLLPDATWWNVSSSRSQTDISTTGQRLTTREGLSKKFVQAPTRPQMTRRGGGGGGRIVVGCSRRVPFSNTSKPCLLPTHWMWLRGQQETVSLQLRANLSPPSAASAVSMVACLSHQLQGPEGSRKNGRDVPGKPEESAPQENPPRQREAFHRPNLVPPWLPAYAFALSPHFLFCQMGPGESGCIVRRGESDIVTLGPTQSSTVGLVADLRNLCQYFGHRNAVETR